MSVHKWVYLHGITVQGVNVQGMHGWMCVHGMYGMGVCVHIVCVVCVHEVCIYWIYVCRGSVCMMYGCS